MVQSLLPPNSCPNVCGVPSGFSSLTSVSCASHWQFLRQPLTRHLSPHHKRQQSEVGNAKRQDLPATSLREVGDPLHVISGMLVREKSVLPLSLPAVPLPLVSCCLCLERVSPYRLKPGSKKSTQLIFARNCRFSISTSLTTQLFQCIHSQPRMEQL